jgi:glycosyltransferase involved in cell wall biosynthesis
MKLLISAFACAPVGDSSEQTTGWNWTIEAHRLGHQIWVLVCPAHRDAIASAVREDAALKEIRWVFPELAYWPVKQGKEPRHSKTYNLLWQKAALRVATALHREVGFDVVHHLTWAGFRIPTFLGSLGPPLILGPIGGGETSPTALRDGFPLRGRISERIRDFANATVMINPWIRRELIAAAIIFASTSDTRDLFSRSVKDKTFIFTQLWLVKPASVAPRVARQGPPRLLCVARLVYWKGVHIAIRAFAQVLSRYPEVRLTLLGRGPEEHRIRAEATRYNIADRIDFISWLPNQKQLFDLYESHDIFVFPSLHDSAGFAVLEAISRGLPVVCLDLGGPKDTVTPNSGVIVKTDGLNSAQLAARMADEICNLLNSPATLAKLSAGAISRAQDFLLPNRVAEFYRQACNFIETRGCNSTEGPLQSHASCSAQLISRAHDQTSSSFARSE